MKKLSVTCILVLVYVFFVNASIMKVKDINYNKPRLIKHQIVNSKPLEVSIINGEVPLSFVQNFGQVNKEVLFYTRTSNYKLWITNKGLVFDRIRRKESIDSGPQKKH